MQKKRLSQETLKLIACVSMLADHIGAVLVPGAGLRIVGRLAFPIYCFLLCEGVTYTRNFRGYGLRLAVGALLAEIPFDLLFYGELSWAHQNVMVTLLLGFLMLLGMKRTGRLWIKVLIMIPAAVSAELLHTDYGGMGVLLIAVLWLTREIPGNLPIRAVMMTLIFWQMGGYQISLGGLMVPIGMFALLSLIPIGLYSGKKATSCPVVKWGFYLFYPVHMAVLLLIK